MSTFAAGAGDVLWSLGFLARHAWVIVLLAVLPAAQRIFAAFHPDDPRTYSWPVEVLVLVLRLTSVVVVFWLGWRADASLRRAGLDSLGEVFGAMGTYLRHDWARLLIAVLFAIMVFVVLNLLGGPLLESIVRQFSDDARVAEAWSFGVRNLLIIPLFYVFAYGLIRPAFLASGS
jgi:hypothetical protein